MGIEHLPVRLPNGPLLQSGIPKRPPLAYPLKARGLMLRGVVVATYVVDDPDHPGADGTNANGPRSVYCDVIAYSSLSGMRWRAISQCLVRQDRGGIHDGEVWKPKAATLDITGGVLDPNRGSNPANWNGDHVLVGFMDDALNLPVILGGIPHPNADAGVGESSTRQRLQLRVVDGDPRFIKHHGSHFGVDCDGNWLVDSRFAHDGELEETGAEPAPPTDGKGSHAAKLPLDGEFTVALYDMADPENPTEKVQLTIDKNGLIMKMVDDKTTLTIAKDTVTIDVENGANPITIRNGEIQLGGDGDKAVTLSGIVDELDRLKADHNDLADAVAKTRGVSNWVVNPLIPNPGKPLAQTIKSVVEYVTKQSILPTGPEDIVLTNAPLDAEAGVGEFVPPLPPDPDNLLRESGLYPGSSVPGDPSSDLVKLKS